MDANRNARNKKLGESLIKALASRNMEGYYADSKEEALALALSMIPEGSLVGWGGTKSAEWIGLKQALCEGNYRVLNRDLAKNAEEKRVIDMAAYESDYYLTSTNAISEDGILVNIDGNANRVSAIAHGPKHIIMIVGMNKVVKNIEAAWSRARNEAAPTNAQRFDTDTPCKKTGECFDCKNPATICCQFLITRYSKHPGRIKVILVNEVLGY